MEMKFLYIFDYKGIIEISTMSSSRRYSMIKRRIHINAMTTEIFRTILTTSLSTQKEIISILDSNKSLLISCNDESSFYINIIESKQMLIHNNIEEAYIKEYMSTHSKKDFAKDILNMAKSHPSFFLFFMIFSKFEELQIIDYALFYHLLDCIIHYEPELDSFVAEILHHYDIKKNKPK